MKQVDTKAYMTALRSLTEQGHSAVSYTHLRAHET